MKKRYSIRADITMSLEIEIEAENEKEAEKLAKCASLFDWSELKDWEYDIWDIYEMKKTEKNVDSSNS